MPHFERVTPHLYVIKLLLSQKFNNQSIFQNDKKDWPAEFHCNALKYLSFMAFSGIVLYPAILSQKECHEAHRQDIMVDGACPKKSVSPFEPMFTSTTYRTGGTLGVDSGDSPG